MPIAQVNVEEEKALADKYGIEEYPTILFFKNGEPTEYKGDREEHDMFEWLRRKRKPISRHITTSHDLHKFQAINLSCLYVLPIDDQEALNKYEAFAIKYDNIPFGHVTQEGLVNVEVLNSKYNFVIFRNFDKGEVFDKSDTPMTTEQLEKFFKLYQTPLVLNLEQRYAEMIFGGEKDALIVFTDDDEETALEYLKSSAKIHMGELLFVRSTFSNGIGKSLAKFMGVNKGDLPAFRLIKFKGE